MKISDICLKQGQGMRDRAAPPHPGLYQVPPGGVAAVRVESRREWNINSFEHSTLLEDFRRQEKCVPFLSRAV